VAELDVVLMAAGLGSRLGELTRGLPKALISVANKPLMAYGLAFARLLQPRNIFVVGGFEFDQVKATLDSLKAGVAADLPITLVQNSEFRRGNILSFQAARPHLKGEFLLLNVDHIYRPAIADIVTQPAADVTGFIDTDRNLGNDDMKVLRNSSGHIKEIAKTLTNWDCGYVGMTRVPVSARSRYLAEVDAAMAEDGLDIHVERVLARLARTSSPPHCRDISGHGWLEVDTPDERSHAEVQLGDGSWSGLRA
jgi:choline kinase